MQVISKCFPAGWEQSRVPLQFTAAISGIGVPATVGRDDIISKLVEAKIDQALCIQFDLLFGGVAAVCVIGIPS